MKIRLLFSFFLLVSVINSGYSQENNVTDIKGVWEGTYTFLNKNYPIKFEVDQDAKALTGFVYCHKKDSTQYAKYTFKGSIKKNQVDLKGMDFIKENTKGGWCLPVFDLALIEVNGQQMLEGRWKPNFRNKGCLVGVSGRISLLKEIQQINSIPLAVGPKIENKEQKAEQDAYTSGMIEGLKTRDYHALIIAVNDYKDASVTDLDNPVKDGKKLSQTLEAYYNFKKENITFLESPGRTTILDAMERLSKDLDDKDNLVIFYAGHGVWDERLEQGYWLPGDASLDSKSKWISNSTIRDYIRSINSRHTLLISDACFSGGLLKQRGVGKAMINVYNMPSRKAITSGTLTTVPDKSVFIDYLVKYLENNDAPLISADQIFYQTKVSVINNSPNDQVPQYGPIHQAKDEGGEFVFLRINQ